MNNKKEDTGRWTRTAGIGEWLNPIWPEVDNQTLKGT